MNNTRETKLNKKEFCLLILWIISVILVGLIERYNLYEEENNISDNISFRTFHKRRIEIAGVIREEKGENTDKSLGSN